MKVLVACEFSGIVREAFNSIHGVHAISCDILPTEDERVDYHHQGDVREILYDDWDMVVAFPPCTDLASSGARWFEQKRKDGRQQIAIEFFMLFTQLKCKWAIENPIGIMSTLYRKPNQIVQPWMFGHGETKATCLWLNGLPTLKPTKIVSGREQRIWKMPPSETRWRDRSRTYSGIARAMADQWGVLG